MLRHPPTTPPPEDLNSLLSILGGVCLTTTCKPSSGESHVVFWPLVTCYHACIHLDIYTVQNKYAFIIS